MLDRLLPELLSAILLLAAPPPGSSASVARERRATLVSCASTCTALYRAARPLLWERVDLFHPAEVEALARLLSSGESEELVELATRTRTVALNGSAAEAPLDARQRVLRAFSGAEVFLVLRGPVEGFPPEQLMDVLNLTSLALESTSSGLFDFSFAPADFYLPRLRHLSLHDIRDDQASALLMDFFTPSVLPSLTATRVSLSGPDVGYLPVLLFNSELVHSGTLPLLEVDLTRASAYVSYIATSLPEPELPTVVVLTISFDDTLSWAPNSLYPFVKHLRVVFSSTTTAETACAGLAAVQAQLARTGSDPNKLKSLHLPLSVRTLDPVAALEAVCAAHGVEVVWHPDGVEDERHVDSSLVEFARKWRSREGGAQVEEEGAA
ncbi:hypothetical protein JCM10207_007273 [Rhodosporidiobolus poonsookiae]